MEDYLALKGRGRRGTPGLAEDEGAIALTSPQASLRDWELSPDMATLIPRMTFELILPSVLGTLIPGPCNPPLSPWECVKPSRRKRGGLKGQRRGGIPLLKRWAS